MGSAAALGSAAAVTASGAGASVCTTAAASPSVGSAVVAQPAIEIPKPNTSTKECRSFIVIKVLKAGWGDKSMNVRSFVTSIPASGEVITMIGFFPQ
jgi:hypothetical protein